ncbi:MAG: DUF2892 domain-containing protein [Rhodomicrobium sp.]|nr:DUF2892 domain-containing protein [Rhodomicrobium sp.]
MKRNVGLTDRFLRVLAGIALLGMAVGQPGTGFDWIGWIGVVPLLTGLIGSCPVYSLLGIDSCGGAETGA